MSNGFIENSEIDQASPTILVHHQIKGAKWGVHRGPPYPLESGINTKVKRKEKSAIKREKGETVKRDSQQKSYTPDINIKASQLSDKELQDRINRFRMESEYNKYVSQMRKGSDFLSKSSRILAQIDMDGERLEKAIKRSIRLAKLFGLIV